MYTKNKGGQLYRPPLVRDTHEDLRAGEGTWQALQVAGDLPLQRRCDTSELCLIDERQRLCWLSSEILSQGFLSY